MARNWPSILIDAALSGVWTSELARRLGVAPAYVSEMAGRYGIQLPRSLRRAGGPPREGLAPSLRPGGAVRRLRPSDWDAELALAAERRETVNAFCRRVRVSQAAAEKHAAARGHVFAKHSRRAVDRQRRRNVERQHELTRYAGRSS